MEDPTGYRLAKMNAQLEKYGLTIKRQEEASSPFASRLWAAFRGNDKVTSWGNLKRTFERALATTKK